MAQPPKLDLVPLDLEPIEEDTPTPTKGTSLSDRWKQISEPLTDAPSRFGQSVSNYITDPTLASSPTGEGGLRDIGAKVNAMLKGFGAGALEGVGNIASSLTSPLSLATIGLGGAEYGAGKAGLGAIARLLGLGTRVASAPFAIHGVSEAVRPDATLGERAMGVAEAAGGAAGMLHVPGGKVEPNVTRTIERPSGNATFNVPKNAQPILDEFGVIPNTKPLSAEAQALSIRPEINPALAESVSNPTVDTPVDLGPIKPNKFFKPNPLGDDPLGDVPRIVAPKLDLQPVVESAPEVSTTSSKVVLPVDLNRSKPRFNIGSASYVPNFVDDLDKALYIIAQKNPSKRDADFLKIVMDATGLNETDARTAGLNVRSAIKEQVKGQPEGSVIIKPIFNNSPTPTPTSTSPVFDASMTSVEGVQAAFRAGKIDGKTSLDLIQKIIRNENKPVPEIQNKITNPTFVVSEEKATPDFLKKANEQGYRIVGMTNEGKYRLSKVAESITSSKVPPLPTSDKPSAILSNNPPNKPPPINEPPIQPKSPNAEPIIVRMKDTPPEQAGIVREAWNVSRGLMSVDLPFITSAGLRQGFPMIGTKAWFEAWGPSIKSYGSKAFHEAHAELLRADPLMQRRTQPALKTDGTQLFKDGRPVLKETPSIAEEAGVVLTDVSSLTTREESIRSQLAERIPIYGRHVAANNRAYTAYINDLRLSTFRNFYEAMPDKNNIVTLKQLGDAANTFTGRGPLKTLVPFSGGKEVSLEKYASGLAEVLFAPKLIASRLQMLNPVNYIMTNPQVRKEYVKAALRTAGAWMTFAATGKLAGAEVSLDPTNTDFGKIKIGNIRFDPGAGFQQFIVYLARMSSNQYTSSTTGKTQDMGVKYNSPTQGSVTQNFIANKMHPSAKFFYDAAFANSSRQFGVFDRMTQMAVPMITGDLIDISREQPELIPIFAPLMSAGLGTQFYTGEKGEMNKPMFIPRQNDIVLGGRR